MITSYFKQAWHLLKQNKLFSTIYIIGTALAIASTTIFAIIYYVRLAPVYPEYKKHQIYTVKFLDVDDGQFTQRMGSFSKDLMQDLFFNLENAEIISAYLSGSGQSLIRLPNQDNYHEIVSRFADPAHFKILDYEFLAGAPFSQDDFDGGLHKVAISDRVCEKLFSSPDEAIGKTVSLDFSDYEICGVFREGSFINRRSYVQALIPYTVSSLSKMAFSPLNGWFNAMILTDNPEGVKAEMDEFCRKYTSTHDDKIIFPNQPFSAVYTALCVSPDDELDFMSIIRTNLLILLTLLIVPALNLSGMIAGRMDLRRGELGIRKSFGATPGKLLRQVLWENLFLTIAGGIFGLVLTWLILSTDAVTIFSNIGSTNRYMPSVVEIRLTSDMLFAPAVFIFAFLVCVVLNILSALIPAWNALRKPIVKSLK
ncbi:MAG: FtsX-like permease family protein [Muribaculaceae bacterium]|nr:FtsX-like permease family protein [Muribaculaceae bacterium]